jgi:hypothetical protein
MANHLSSRDLINITFGDFAALMDRKGWSAEFLAEKFRGKIEEPKAFIYRVLQKQNGEIVIPYRSVVEFYRQAFNGQGHQLWQRVCACGCGQPVWDRKKWASSGCKKKIARQKVTNPQDGLRKVVDFIEARP